MTIFYRPYKNQIFSYKQMLSTSKLGSFCLAQPKSSDKLYKKSKYSSHMISPYDHYKTTLNDNAYQIKKKYPTVQVDEIRSLLQELQNNMEMVSEILQQEQKKLHKNSMEQEQRASETESILQQERNQKSQASKTEEIRILRNSLAKLFKKLSGEIKEKEELQKKVGVLTRQNESLKHMNQHLMNEQMGEMDFIKNLDIC